MMKTSTIVQVMVMLTTVIIAPGCDDLLEVKSPASHVSQKRAFANDTTATAVINGVYADMLLADSFASGGYCSVAFLSALCADEITHVGQNANLKSFENNAISPVSKYVLNLWTSAYKTIYQANSAIEGLEASPTLSPALKNQLLAEVLFIRAFAYFHLVNVFGDVPLAVSTNYIENAQLSRMAASVIYDQITVDLTTAEQLISDAYVETGRHRPNKAAVQSLLARVFLYRQDWTSAIATSTKVIANPQYALPQNLDDVFLAHSVEAIWQLAYPADRYVTTYEGSIFVVLQNHDVENLTTTALLNAFEPDDRRLAQWIGTFDTGTEKVYFPYKYKIKYDSRAAVEHATPLRLAEQYLIRAEAYAQQGESARAMADVDVIRKRAGLQLLAAITPSLSKTALIEAIQHERRVELFTEGAHRWFDLKRTNTALPTLQEIKPGLSAHVLLYPLPEDELSKNPSLKTQNPGY
jgi:starch-binding outer membrane protein, SusD/RagB family